MTWLGAAVGVVVALLGLAGAWVTARRGATASPYEAIAQRVVQLEGSDRDGGAHRHRAGLPSGQSVSGHGRRGRWRGRASGAAEHLHPRQSARIRAARRPRIQGGVTW